MKSIHEALREHRKERFTAKVTPCQFPLFKDEMTVSVSHNGYQSQEINLSPGEAKKVIGAILIYLKELKENK